MKEDMIGSSNWSPGEAMNLSRRQYSRLMMVGAAGAVPFLAAACSGPRGTGDSGRRSTLNVRIALSPDGRVVAFPAGVNRIGLFDWRTGRVDTIPGPLGVTSLTWLSYSADGRKISAVATLSAKETSGINQQRLAIVDLSTHETTLFKVEQRVFSNTAFRPDGKAILYSADGQLFLFDLGKKTSQALLSVQDRFFNIASPSFISNDAILFVGMGPKNAEIQATLKGLGANPVASSIPYILRASASPEIAYLDFVKRELSDRYTSPPSSMSASRNGERIVFIELSQSDAARKAALEGGPSRYDLFVMEGGQVRQATHLENYMSFQAISQDGSTAAFGIYPGQISDVRGMRRGTIPLELAIVDLNTGQVTRTDFTKRIAGELRSKAAAN